MIYFLDVVESVTTLPGTKLQPGSSEEGARCLRDICQPLLCDHIVPCLPLTDHTAARGVYQFPLAERTRTLTKDEGRGVSLVTMRYKPNGRPLFVVFQKVDYVKPMLPVRRFEEQL